MVNWVWMVQTNLSSGIQEGDNSNDRHEDCNPCQDGRLMTYVFICCYRITYVSLPCSRKKISDCYQSLDKREGKCFTHQFLPPRRQSPIRRELFLFYNEGIFEIWFFCWSDEHSGDHVASRIFDPIWEGWVFPMQIENMILKSRVEVRRRKKEMVHGQAPLAAKRFKVVGLRCLRS